ncbi:uncharacterized protein F5Z01DRAFT_670164 [Emericellopsis atlantica]|uniref:Uncharacterized protein n=1 Tax=Emericellopsis atlantica TaxID=2614577 RepID=A0A9P7ZUA1_9HYPO|nr:uncharacterized protein F5Z01DRAFT_670164 [Emericellopsis atlantica]KAG9258444.1 hypothetical protein F5Z01DRAFT_670164 [Emericellopsis atlantica]
MAYQSDFAAGAPANKNFSKIGPRTPGQHTQLPSPATRRATRSTRKMMPESPLLSANALEEFDKARRAQIKQEKGAGSGKRQATTGKAHRTMKEEMAKSTAVNQAALGYQGHSAKTVHPLTYSPPSTSAFESPRLGTPEERTGMNATSASTPSSIPSSPLQRLNSKHSVQPSRQMQKRTQDDLCRELNERSCDAQDKSEEQVQQQERSTAMRGRVPLANVDAAAEGDSREETMSVPINLGHNGDDDKQGHNRPCDPETPPRGKRSRRRQNRQEFPEEDEPAVQKERPSANSRERAGHKEHKGEGSYSGVRRREDRESSEQPEIPGAGGMVPGPQDPSNFPWNPNLAWNCLAIALYAILLLMLAAGSAWLPYRIIYGDPFAVRHQPAYYNEPFLDGTASYSAPADLFSEPLPLFDDLSAMHRGLISLSSFRAFGSGDAWSNQDPTHNITSIFQNVLPLGDFWDTKTYEFSRSPGFDKDTIVLDPESLVVPKNRGEATLIDLVHLHGSVRHNLQISIYQLGVAASESRHTQDWFSDIQNRLDELSYAADLDSSNDSRDYRADDDPLRVTYSPNAHLSPMKALEDVKETKTEVSSDHPGVHMQQRMQKTSLLAQLEVTRDQLDMLRHLLAHASIENLKHIKDKESGFDFWKTFKRAVLYFRPGAPLYHAVQNAEGAVDLNPWRRQVNHLSTEISAMIEDLETVVKCESDIGMQIDALVTAHAHPYETVVWRGEQYVWSEKLDGWITYRETKSQKSAEPMYGWATDARAQAAHGLRACRPLLNVVTNHGKADAKLNAADQKGDKETRGLHAVRQYVPGAKCLAARYRFDADAARKQQEQIWAEKGLWRMEYWMTREWVIEE